MKATTPYKDGAQLFTKIDPKQEIVGYFGYLDDKDLVLAIGLIIATHEEEGAEEAAAQEGAEVKKNAQVEEIEQSD